MRNQETMFKIIEEYENSGLSQKEFANRNELRLSTFTYWIRKKRSSESGGGFREVIPENDLGECVEICYPNGVLVRTRRWELIGSLVRLF